MGLSFTERKHTDTSASASFTESDRCTLLRSSSRIVGNCIYSISNYHECQKDTKQTTTISPTNSSFRIAPPPTSISSPCLQELFPQSTSILDGTDQCSIPNGLPPSRAWESELHSSASTCNGVRTPHLTNQGIQLRGCDVTVYYIVCLLCIILKAKEETDSFLVHIPPLSLCYLV